MKTMVFGIMRDLEAEEKAYRAKWNEIAKAAKSIRGQQIESVCARYELESDEFYTREQKAIRIINAA